MAITTAVVAGVASVGGAVHAREEAKSAERQVKRDQEEANRVRKAQAGAERGKARRRAIASQRLQQARNLSAASSMGISGSSAVEGAQGALASNTASSFQSENRALASGNQIFSAQQSAENARAKGQRRANTANAVGGLFATGTGIAAGQI